MGMKASNKIATFFKYFVLILVGVIGMQLQLSSTLQDEVRQRQAEMQRRKTLEQALAVPLAAGRVTLINGHREVLKEPSSRPVAHRRTPPENRAEQTPKMESRAR